MNYSTEVKFSNNLIKKGKTTITYTGTLYRTGSASVTLVYGFGDNWEHTTEKEMTKNENDFSVEVDLLDYDKINFCFRNSDNIWDNNNYLNYMAPISEPEKDYDFIINENLIEGILNELFETDLSTQEVSNTIQTEAIENQTDASTIELVESSVISEESFVIEIPETDSADLQEFMVDSTEEPSLTSDLEAAFAIDESQDLKKEEIVNFDMDALIDEILSPMLEAKAQEAAQDNKVNVKLNELDTDGNIFDYSTEGDSSEDSLLEDYIGETALVEVKDSEPNFLVSARSLSKFYMLKKKIKLALYKFFTAIPKIIEANFNEERN